MTVATHYLIKGVSILNNYRLLSVLLCIFVAASCISVGAFAQIEETVTHGYDYSYTYADIDFDQKDNWNDTVNFNQLGYGKGTGEISIAPSGIGSFGNSARLVTDGNDGTMPDAVRVSFDFMLPAFDSSELSFDLKFGSTWHSGLHVRKSGTSGSVLLQGSVIKNIDALTWHSVSYVINNTVGKYDIYLDGNFVKTLSVASGAGNADSVEVGSKTCTLYVDNVSTTVVNPQTNEVMRTVSAYSFEDTSLSDGGWFGTNMQKISGLGEITDEYKSGTSGKSLKLWNSANIRFFLGQSYVAGDKYGTTTQINDIRAEITEGIAVYSMDFLFKDFLTEKSLHINSLLDDGTYSWKLGGFKVYPSKSTESYLVTTGVSTGAKSPAITIDTWYNIKLIVDMDSGKIYYIFEDTVIDTAYFGGVTMLYRASVAADATAVSEMYLDNVNITCYTKEKNLPSVFESDEDISGMLTGFGAVHTRSGCIVKPDGTKLLSEFVPLIGSNGETLFDESVIEALFESPDYEKIYSEIILGTKYYSLTDCAYFSGKKAVYDNSAKNGGMYIIGDTEFELSSYDELQRLNDYCFYLRPDSSLISDMYDESNISGTHSRLLCTDDDFDLICERAKQKDSEYEKLADRLFDYADWCLSKGGIVTYTKNDGDTLRMNSMATAFDTYVYTVSVAWKLATVLNPSKAEAYRNYVWQQVESVASFPDWNPAHHIDHGIFSSGFAIAYDIMYDAWSEEQKRIMEDAALKNGLSWYAKSYQITYSAMTDAAYIRNNHNAMTNGNAIVLSLAFMDAFPDECSYVLSNAIRGLENMLINYSPEGSWWEGVFYSHLNMSYLCPALRSLESVLGSCLRLDRVQGYDGAGDFVELAQSDVGIYNFADADEGTFDANVWYQTHFGRDWSAYLGGVADGRIYAGGKTLAEILMASSESVETEKTLPLDKCFENTGLAVMHDSFNKGQTFVGIKAGDTVYEHSHFDSGSFIYDWNGVRWACDLGKDDYNLPGFWDSSGDRWKIFRNRAESHNTVIVDPDMNPDYKIGSSAPITHFETTAAGGIVKVDTSDLYDGRLSDAKRAYCFTDNRKSLVVRDELTTLSGKTSDIYSMIYTKARVSVDYTKNKVILTDRSDSSKKVMIEFLCSHPFTVTYQKAQPMSGTPVVSGQNSNSGFYRIALKTTASGNVTITYKITPVGIASTPVEDYDLPISQWSGGNITSGGDTVCVHAGALSNNAYAIFALYSSDGVLSEASIKQISPPDGVVRMQSPFTKLDGEKVKFMYVYKNNLKPIFKAVELK